MAIKGGEVIISPAYRDVQRLHGRQSRVPQAQSAPHMPELPHLPHIPHKKGVLAAATLTAILAIGATGLFNKEGSVKPELTGNIGPGGIAIKQETFPIGKPLTINFDTNGNIQIQMDTTEGQPQFWTRDLSSVTGEESIQYMAVLGPEYDSTNPNGLGRVQIIMGDSENNPDIIFGGVWLERVNSDGIPVGMDGQVLYSGESPIYIRPNIQEAPQEPMAA